MNTNRPLVRIEISNIKCKCCSKKLMDDNDNDDTDFTDIKSVQKNFLCFSFIYSKRKRKECQDHNKKVEEVKEI